MKTETTAAIDLSAFQPADIGVLAILQPGTGRPTGWEITFAGPSHDKTLAWANASARDELRRQAQLEAQLRNGRKVKPDDIDVDQVRRENVARVVARIVDWTPVKLDPNGPTIVFNEAAATELLLDPRLSWVYLQALEFLNDERSFTRASAKP
ncbi:branched-chain amino acid ABC transporter [Bosea sp. FBZP-16]|uniref:branched-chain amino acid ABC transporter n=1 Tax=Bosea sp. FBZP-16 TaxID=2065382 RepID=UPI000C31AFBD|nr:branched-chain amino acid ABC transporter [Bosea sp. FBZP-16]